MTPISTTAKPMERWLRELQRQSPTTFLLGCIGHLVLSEDDRYYVKQQLASEILPEVLSELGHLQLLILTSLAPGADHLFDQTAVAYAREHHLRYRLIGLQPLPIAVKLDDWAEKLAAEGQTVSPRQRTQQLADMEAVRVACDRVVHLMPPGTSEEQIGEHSFRQSQYQRLAACLAEQSDVLVAIVRTGNNPRVGGTAQVVQWRQELSRVPASISTLGLRDHLPAQDGKLFTIDPDIVIGNTGYSV